MLLPIRGIHNMQRLLRLLVQCHTKINPLSTSCMQRIALTPVDNTYIHCNSYHSLSLQDSGLLTPRRADINLPQARSKARKPNKKSEATESESDEESESDSDSEGEEEEEIESELDYDSPMVHKDLEINTLRADSVAAKSLKYSKSDADMFFYKSKFLLNGKKLLKKGTKLSPGDILDLVVDHSETKISVKRVKVIKVKGVSKKGNDIVHVRAWRDPFEIDPPENYQRGGGDSEVQE